MLRHYRVIMTLFIISKCPLVERLDSKRSDSEIVFIPIILGVTRLDYCASQSCVFAFGSMVLAHPFVCGFSALRAEKPHTLEK